MNLSQTRKWFAKDLKYTTPVHCEAVVNAFAQVPRENFLGPPPWLLVYPNRPEADLETDDPRDLYHNVLVAIDRARGINNGEPRLWAGLYDKLKIRPGETILHVGAGLGYYTAILAEITGKDGHVTALEFDEDFAARAKANLADRPNVTLIHGDGCVYDPGAVDVIIVNAGVTHPLPIWLDRLRPGGRLLVPLTNDEFWGHFLMVTKVKEGYAAQFVSRVGIIPCVSHRDPEAAAMLNQAFRNTPWPDLSAVRSLRRDGTPDDTCVLAGPDYWLSKSQPG